MHLDELLEEVRSNIGRNFDIENIMIVLAEKERQELDVRLHYWHGQKRRPTKRPIESGLEGWLLARGEPMLISDDVDEFALRNGIGVQGEIPACWMGVTLRVNGKTIGGVILQSFQQTHLFIERDLRFLTLIADQVAGAITIAWPPKKSARIWNA